LPDSKKEIILSISLGKWQKAKLAKLESEKFASIFNGQRKEKATDNWRE